VLRKTMLTHDWNLTPQAAIKLQKALREKIRLEPLTGDIRYIGGTDLSYNKGSDQFYAGIVILDYSAMQVEAHATVIRESPFPYIPGLLSFREIPALLAAWELLPFRPDLLIADGHGIAHPRRMGIAAHLGLVTACPAIGCAKKILTGAFAMPQLQRGQYSPIDDRGKTIGYALCTKDRVKPVFVSPGHRVGMTQSREIVLHCARG